MNGTNDSFEESLAKVWEAAAEDRRAIVDKARESQGHSAELRERSREVRRELKQELRPVVKEWKQSSRRARKMDLRPYDRLEGKVERVGSRVWRTPAGMRLRAAAYSLGVGVLAVRLFKGAAILGASILVVYLIYRAVLLALPYLAD